MILALFASRALTDSLNIVWQNMHSTATETDPVGGDPDPVCLVSASMNVNGQVRAEICMGNRSNVNITFSRAQALSTANQCFSFSTSNQDISISGGVFSENPINVPEPGINSLSLAISIDCWQNDCAAGSDCSYDTGIKCLGYSDDQRETGAQTFTLTVRRHLVVCVTVAL
jgi:hypothetical protein